VQHFVDRIFELDGLLVPIVAIIVGGVIAVVAMVHKHQERLAKIERGINPDAPWPVQQQR
jgi:ABC-type enterochelin transport system permease subunit